MFCGREYDAGSTSGQSHDEYYKRKKIVRIYIFISLVTNNNFLQNLNEKLLSEQFLSF